MSRQGRLTSFLRGVSFWLLVFLFLTPSPVWGAIIPDGGGGGCIPENVTNVNLKDALACMLANLANFLISVAPGVFVILLAFGGIKYMASAGEERSLLAAKQFLTWVILGFIAVFGVIFIIRVLMFILHGEPGILPFF